MRKPIRLVQKQIKVLKRIKKRKNVQKNIRTLSDKKLFKQILQNVKFSYYYYLGRGFVDRYPEKIPLSLYKQKNKF